MKSLSRIWGDGAGRFAKVFFDWVGDFESLKTLYVQNVYVMFK